jgi:sterol desaturase/sphingolipid hydroxylase (fatty acid hydroxylase superfamily)
VLVGNELHRYHHSADLDEAKNFGNIVPLWDIVFGTFVYRPGDAPKALGLADPSRYPADVRILGVLSLPFTGGKSRDHPGIAG